MADLFISYAREDRPRCTRIRDALAEFKLDVWVDAGIAAGDSFDRKIEKEIDQAAGVMVLWSETSAQSNWVRNEARTGAERDALVAVKLDECTLPLEFRSIHTDLLPEGGENEAHPVWLNLLARIGELTGRPGLPDYARLRHENADVEAWKRWLTRHAGDPLAGEVIETVIGSASPEMRRQLAEERAKRAALEAELAELRDSSKAHSGEIATSARETARMRHELETAQQSLAAAEAEIDRLRAGSGLPAKRGFWESDQAGVGLVLDDRLGLYVGALLWIFAIGFTWGPLKQIVDGAGGVDDIFWLVLGVLLLIVPAAIVTLRLIQRRRAAQAAAAPAEPAPAGE